MSYLVTHYVGFGGGGDAPTNTVNFSPNNDGLVVVRTFKTVLETGLFGGINGSQVRITLKASPSGTTYAKTYFGKQSSGASAVSLSEVLFSGATGPGALAGSATAVSDWLSVGFTAADNWIVSVYMSAGGVGYSNSEANTGTFYKNSVDEAATASVSGYTDDDAEAPFAVSKFEWR